MKRLYYLFHGTEFARAISNDLKAVGIDEGQLHFLSNDQAGLQVADVHQADIFDQRDIPHSGVWGAITGLGVGFLFASYLIATELGSHMNLGVFLFVCILFTFFGTWAGGFIGISNDNHHIARFHNALNEGDTLLMVDAYDEKEESRLRELMHTRHMEASYEGEEENFKVFL